MTLTRRLALTAPLVIAACGQSGSSESSRASRVLKIASQKGSTRALLEVSGVLEGAPYRVEWSEFAAASPLLEALGAGAADVGAVGDAPFVFAYAAGAPIRVVLASRSADTNAGSSVAVIVPRASAIRSPADLAGRRVATVRGSVGHFLLLRLLERETLDPSSVHTIFLDPGAARGALSSGAVDAWSTWSPYVGFGLLHDQDRILADGRGLFSGLGFVAANAGSIDAKGPLILDLVRRLQRAYAFGQSRPDAYAARLATETGVPLDVARDMAKRYRLHPIPMDESVVAEETRTVETFRGAGLIERVPNLEGAFARQFNAALQPA